VTIEEGGETPHPASPWQGEETALAGVDLRSSPSFDRQWLSVDPLTCRRPPHPSTVAFPCQGEGAG